MPVVDPAWVLVGFTIMQVVFTAGVFFGGFVPLRGQVKDLAVKIETAGQLREKHTESMVEIRTVVHHLEDEMRRLRDGYRDEDRRVSGREG